MKWPIWPEIGVMEEGELLPLLLDSLYYSPAMRKCLTVPHVISD